MKSMYKGMCFVLVLSMLLLAFGTSSVNAQAGVTTLTSSMQLYNQSTSIAHITIDFYSGAGVVELSMSDTIDPSSSKTYFVSTTSLPAGFSGSAVISSDQPISAISNMNTTDYAYASATTSFSGGNTTFNLPLVMCNNSGFNTAFSVQNVGTSDAHITVYYNRGSHGANSSETATIAPGASKMFDQKTGSSTVNCSTLVGTDGKFIGSAVIESSDQPIVATVIEANTTTFKILMQYNGFPSGTETVGLPLIMAQNSSFSTGVQIMNVGAGSCDTITMTYSANTASGHTWVPTAESFSLAAGASKTIMQSGSSPSNGSVNNFNTAAQHYIGSATVAGTACELVGIVNQSSAGSPSMGPFGSSYEGFDPSSATANLVAPLIMAQNSGYYTSVQIQNSGADCASVTMTYGPNVASGKTWVPTAEVFSLLAGASKTFLQSGTAPANGSVVGNNFNDPVLHKYVGSATVSAPGCSVIAIVNEQRITLGDKLYSYDAFNY